MNMKSRNLSVLVLFLSLVFVFLGCKKDEAVSPEKETTLLQIVKFGPVKIQSGKDFNVQPNGVSAMWAKTENATKATILVWGETKLKSAVGGPNAVTAEVPIELYSKPGQFERSLLESKTGEKSNKVVVTVQ